MSIKHIPATLNKNQLFLVGIIIIYFISLAQFARCSNENNIRALTEELKKNELGKIIYETFQIDYELSYNKNTFGFEKSFNRIKSIIDYKSNEQSYFNQHYLNYNNQCEKDILLLNNKAKAIKNTLSQAKDEKNHHDLKIKNQRINLEIIKFTKDHFINKLKFFNKIQKRFFLNKYLLLPILEDLIDFTKYLKAHILLLKRNHALSDKKETNKIISDFLQNETFKKLNKNLNLIEQENIIALENYTNQPENKNTSEDFLKSKSTNHFNFPIASKKCLFYRLESYSDLYFNINEFLIKNLNDYKQKYKHIIYCSGYLSLLRYFSLNFNKDYLSGKWSSKRLDKIHKMLKLIVAKFESKVDSINKKFEEISHKFTGSNTYLNNQIKFFQEKEEKIEKEITLIKEESFASKAEEDYTIETKYIQDLISFKSQLAKAENFAFGLTESEANLLNNMKKLNKIISFDSSIIREMFQIKKDSNDDKNYKNIKEEIPSFIELENVLSNDIASSNSKSLEIQDIDFDAI